MNGEHPANEVFPESFFTCKNHLAADSADVLITSPPYLNNYHYNRNTRPHLYWLGFAEAPRDLKPLEEQNFGKFWQTVRDQECVGLSFELDDPEIQGCLETLRKKTPRKRRVRRQWLGQLRRLVLQRLLPLFPISPLRAQAREEQPWW